MVKRKVPYTLEEIDAAFGLRHGYVEECEKRITALEAENTALREFVRLIEDVVFLMAHREDGDWFHDARQRLAAEHGLPLPGAEDGA